MTPIESLCTRFARDLSTLIRDEVMHTVTSAMSARPGTTMTGDASSARGATKRLGRPPASSGRLLDRLRAYLAEHPGSTATEAGRGLDYTVSAIRLTVRRNLGLFRQVPGAGRRKHLYLA